MKKIIVLCAAAALLLSGCAGNNGEISDSPLSITDSAPSISSGSSSEISDSSPSSTESLSSTSSESGRISDKEISDKDIFDMTTMGEEFCEYFYLPEEAFEAFNGQYLKVAIGKGLISMEELASLYTRYGNLLGN